MEGKHYTGTHFGVFEVTGRAAGQAHLGPASFDPDPTPMMGSFEELQTSPLRILRPAVRKGYLESGSASRSARGDEPFVEVGWDRALDLAAAGLREVYDKHGAAAVYGGSYGWASAGRFHHAQSQIHRFLNLLGGYTASVNTYSHAAAEILLPYVVGQEDDIIYSGTTWPVIRDHTKLIVAFGGLPSVTGQVSPGGVSAHTNLQWVRELAKAGVRLITIGPVRSHIDDTMGSEWLRLRPNSDTALMLALAWQIHETARSDLSFLERYTTGFERFLPYLTGQSDGQPKTPDWAAPICGLPADRIRLLAEEIVAQRTLLTASWALQRARHGEQPFWMLIVLAAMTGQIGLPGGGFAFGLSSFNGVANPVQRRRYGAVPQGHNPVAQAVPVARITEMLENPGGRIAFDGGTVTLPDIRAICWAGGNPFHHHQNLARLQRAWRRPDLVIVNEIEWTATARRADIVFPVCSAMERDDVMAPNSDRRIVALRKCVEPRGESRTDHDIFAALADRFGKRRAFTEGRSEEDWLRHLHEAGQVRFRAAGHELPGFDNLWRAGVHVHCPDHVSRVLLEDFRADPAAHRLQTPSGRIEIFSEAIAAFGYSDCPGHPVWLAPEEWLGAELARRYPLHLLSPQPRSRLHGQLDGNGISAASKIRGREPCYISHEDANERGINDGDILRLWNDRGAVLCGARRVEWVMPGCVVLPTGAWYSPMDGDAATCAHGNPNVLTSDRPTSSLSQGPAPNSTLIQAELYTDPLPPVMAHQPPEFTTEEGTGRP
jgi:biotin/methionine sulfoxide reductase